MPAIPSPVQSEALLAPPAAQQEGSRQIFIGPTSTLFTCAGNNIEISMTTVIQNNFLRFFPAYLYSVQI